MFKLFAVSLFVLVSHAHAKTQAIIVGNDDRPFTVHASGKFDMGGYTQKSDHGMGAKSLGGNLGLSHYAGHDFEYGINLFNGWATSVKSKLFADSGKDDGFKTAVNLSARYMPEIFPSIRLGGLASIGYSRLFGEGDKAMHNAFTFGDTNFDIGPSFMHHPTSFFAWGFGITYGMTEMRFGGAKANERDKQYSNLHTVRIPFDFVVQATENIGVALAFDPAWRHLGSNHKFHHGIFYDIAAGVNIGF